MAEIFELDGTSPDVRLDGCSCAIGVFDGVHLGHRMLIETAIEDARSRGARSVVLTFDIDPDELFAKGLEKLQSNEERIETLASLPVDYLAVITFNRAFASLSPEDFLDGLFGRSRPAQVFVGEDFRFGNHASGDVRFLEEWASKHAMTVRSLGLLEVDGEPVKSTRIRKLLDAGNTEEARKLMGRP